MGGGQGDVIMAACGLHAMLGLAPELFANDMVCYTRTFIAEAVRVMLPECVVDGRGALKEAKRPRYYTSANTSGSTVLRNLFGQDYYVNFAAGRRRASFGEPAPGFWTQAGQWITGLAMDKNLSWRRRTPNYYGAQMWAPLVTAAGKTEIDLQRSLYQSFPILRRRLRDYAQSLPEVSAVSPGLLAVFPVGRSFQTLPAEFLAAVMKGYPLDRFCCFFQEGDPREEKYRALGLPCATANTPESLIKIMATAQAVMACDSLPSHLSQLIARRSLLVMSHDIPDHTVHPASDAVIAFTAMPCVPCSYVHKEHASQCMAGRPHCGVFDHEDYRGKVVDWLKSLLGEKF